MRRKPLLRKKSVVGAEAAQPRKNGAVRLKLLLRKKSVAAPPKPLRPKKNGAGR